MWFLVVCLCVFACFRGRCLLSSSKMNTSYFHPRCLSSSPDLSESKTFAYFYIKVYSFESGYKNILIRALVKVVDWISPILTICSHLEELIFLCSLLCGVFSISFCQAISFIYKYCCTLRISEQGRIAGVIYKKEGDRNAVPVQEFSSLVFWFVQQNIVCLLHTLIQF